MRRGSSGQPDGVCLYIMESVHVSVVSVEDPSAPGGGGYPQGGALTRGGGVDAGEA